MREPLDRGDRIFLAVLASLMLLAYAPGLPVAPAYDDAVGVFHNPKMLRPGEILKGFFLPSPGGPLGIPLPAYAYRPLTELSYWVNGLAAGSTESLSLVGLRIGSLLVHATAVLVAFLLARRLGPAEGAFARWAAAFFALHPMAQQAVAYLYQRSVSLEALLAFLALLLYWRARPRFSWGALAAAFLATGAKETAVTLPLMLGAMEWILRGSGETPRGILRRLGPFLLPPLVPLVMAVLSVRAHGEAPDGGFSRLEYLALQMPVLVRYAALHAWPFPLRFYWDRDVPLPLRDAAIPLLPVLLCGALLLGGVAWILLGPERHRLQRLGLALFLAPLALESSFFPILDLAWNYRTYPSLMGSALLFAWALGRNRIAASAVLALLAASTFAENRFWQDRRALLARDVRSAFHVPTIWANLGWHTLDLGQPRAAEPLLAHALTSGWKDIKARSGHIRALTLLGRREEALEETRRMGREFPLHTATLWVEVQQATLRKDREELDRLADRVQGVGILRPELLLWLAERRTDQGRLEEAERILLDHRQAYPAYPGLWDHLGWVHFRQERFAEAEAAYRKALALESALPKAHFNLGCLLLKRGDVEGARAEFEAALRWAPDYAKARSALAGLGKRPAGNR